MSVVAEFLLLWGPRLAYAALSLAFLLSLFRIIYGPRLTDRVVALNLTSYVVIAVAAVVAVDAGEPALLNVALAVGVFVFLGTVACARYVEVVAIRREAEEI